MRAGGTADEPMQTQRRLEMSAPAKPGRANRACAIAGTMAISVGRSSTSALRTAAGSNRRWTMTAAPARRPGRVWMFMPPTWNIGIAVRMRSALENSKTDWPLSAV